MQVNIGAKIRELRKRDGRKQEDLASALGVTAQAVSRWEANGGFPDMNMLPAIANYFHVSIDSLFGYENDREFRINEYIAKAQSMISANQDVSECISLLKQALFEFPGEKALTLLLADALYYQGWYRKKDGPENYWEEAIKLYEELLPDNQNCIIPLLSLYSELGKVDEAIQKAKAQPSLEMSKEVLLAHISNAPESNHFSEKAVLSLIHELRYTIDTCIAQDDVLSSSVYAIDILKAERRLLELILGSDCGNYHSEFCFIDLECARISNALNDTKATKQFTVSARTEYMQWQEAQNNSITPQFDTPLLQGIDTSYGVTHNIEQRFFDMI